MRGRDLNPRPPGYEPDELPNCSTPRCLRTFDAKMIILCPPDSVKGIFPKIRRLREKISKRHSRLCQRGSRRAGRGRDAGGTREGRGRDTRRLARSGRRAHPLTDAGTGTLDVRRSARNRRHGGEKLDRQPPGDAPSDQKVFRKRRARRCASKFCGNVQELCRKYVEIVAKHLIFGGVCV